MNKYIIEFIGTFFLVLVVGLTAGRVDMAPIAIGFTLMVMVYMGGHISGGHYNPAVTLACLLRGACTVKDAVPYWIVQLAGGIVAAVTAKFLLAAAPGAPALGEGVSTGQALVNECLFTFALASVVLHTATSKDHEGNSFYGLAIGSTVLIGAFAGGGISGGAYNPAVGLGANVINGTLGDVWIYFAGPLIGGALAAVVFKITSLNDKAAA